MEKSKEDIRNIYERKEELAVNVEKKIDRIEETITKEIEHEKLTRTEYNENWVKKSD